MALAPRISPQGHLHLDGEPAGDVEIGLRDAFAAGSGAGLLHLGAHLVDAPLDPALAFFRDVAARFVARLAGSPDLEENRSEIDVPAPDAELDALARNAPPIVGAEYLDGALLSSLWRDLERAFREAIARWDGSVARWLARQHPAWHAVGRVCFHLAENRRDPSRPFAFLATYTVGVAVATARQPLRHRALGHALRDFAGDRAQLVSLLEPVERAAANSPLVRELVATGHIYHPLAWSPDDAYKFLQEVPACEAAGVTVRVPDWWKARPRVRVQVTVGQAPPSTLGLDGLLDFRVGLSLDGEPLTEDEWRALMRQGGAGGELALVRGKCVELDRARLGETLDHFREVARRAGDDGLSLLEGMRLLAGTPLDGDALDADLAPGPSSAREWSRVDAGEWLRGALDGMRASGGVDKIVHSLGGELQATLRPYQRVGVGWLHFLDRLRLGACLADDMGLGKTLQVIALLLLQRRETPRPTSLLVAPASLLGNWLAEIEKFAPSLRTFVAHPSARPAAELRTLTVEDFDGADLVLTTYGTLARLEPLRAIAWRTVILDEAQAIKNPGARQTRAVKSLHAQSRVSLTGTPVENRLGDLWSQFDFLNPGLLGTPKQFSELCRKLGAVGGPGYGPLRELVRPYLLRRLKTDRTVAGDLPDKTELAAYCGLSRRQAALYQQSVASLADELKTTEGPRRRALVLSYLLRFKMICNHPSHWLRDGAWAEGESGKLARLAELCEPIAARQEKVLVFTQFREATEPLAQFLAGVFGRAGLVLHGDTPVRARKGLVDRFQTDDDVPFFVLSVKAGGTGLNLTAASHVVHFDRWWNPAVEDQATDRAFRIGQRRNVLVHKFVCRGTVEERVDALIESKRSLARDLLSTGSGAEALLTQMDDRALLALVSLDVRSALEVA